MSNKCNVIVTGAGASGIIAAVTAKKAGANVTLIERNSSIGRKISATGNGRCNFTNTDAGSASHYYGGNKSFVENVFSRFTIRDILELFDDIGVTPNIEDDGKYFPLSGQASSVVELLGRYLNDNGVGVIYNTRVKDIDNSGKCISLNTDNGLFTADRVIIATGGMACPDSGSDGAGYILAEKIGHTVKPLLPVIVQLKTKGGFYKRISGLRINASVSLIVNGEAVQKEFGDVMFFDYGLSGSAVFKLSCKAAYALKSGKQTHIIIDCVPQFGYDELNAYITCRCKRMDCNVFEMLVGFVNKKLIQLIVEASGIDDDKSVRKFSSDEINAVCTALKCLKTEVSGTKGWENAQATAGGISLDEVECDTLRSKIDKRIGFCGEILDVVGNCGGYNLSWAWASGFVCGANII